MVIEKNKGYVMCHTLVQQWFMADLKAVPLKVIEIKLIYDISVNVNNSS